MSERLTQTDLLRFAYGEADELEDVILDDPEYLRALEDVWASEMPHDLRGPLVRTLQAQQTMSDTLGVVLDLTIAFGKAIPHYLAADVNQPVGTDADSDEDDDPDEDDDAT